MLLYVEAAQHVTHLPVAARHLPGHAAAGNGALGPLVAAVIQQVARLDASEVEVGEVFASTLTENSLKSLNAKTLPISQV